MAEKRLLLAVGHAGPGIEHLPDGVKLLIDDADEILVISPRLPDRLDWLASDTDKAKQQADERLRSVLHQLEEVDAETGGEIGADDPILAFEDAIAKYSPTHLLIGLRDEDRAGWQERNLLQEIHGKVKVPITIFEIPPG